MRSLFGAAKSRREASTALAACDSEPLLDTAFDAYQRGDHRRARAALERLLARVPDDLDGLQLLASVCLAEAQPDEALRLLMRAAAISPESFEIQVARAQAASMAGEHSVAHEAYLLAVELRPDFGQLYVVAAEACERLGRFDEAVGLYRRGLAVEPRFGPAWLNLGRLLHERGRRDEAGECFERLLALEPDNAKGHFNRALILDQRQDLREAETAYRRALDLDPSLQQARFNLGVVLYQLNRHDEASREFERCDALHAAADAGAPVDADVALAQFNLALARLGRGLLAEGWALFDRRFDLGTHAVPRRPHPQPRWRGETLEGRHLLVWGEQGIGDELLFAGLYGDLPRQGARISIECHAKLAPLLSRSFPWARVVTRATPPAAELESSVDFQIPAGSLAGLYRPTLERFPGRRAYLVADAGRRALWRERVDALGPGLKVGFSWRSSNLAGHRALSCTQLDQWLPLFAVPDVQWICLQYDECAAELDEARRRDGVTLHRFGEVDYFDDLDEVAALMSSLDLVISAPTTVSIQAAALGIETWQMSYGADWQTLGSGRNPWLPAIVRYQRRWDQSWDAVMDELSQHLSRHVAARAAAG